MDFKLAAWSSKKSRGYIELLLVSVSYHSVIPIVWRVIILMVMAIILAGAFCQNIQMSDEHSDGVKKRKKTDDCIGLLYYH
jgi:protein-S-isoprenylcysteine O-methyltransferase Ste14